MKFRECGVKRHGSASRHHHEPPPPPPPAYRLHAPESHEPRALKDSAFPSRKLAEPPRPRSHAVRATNERVSPPPGERNLQARTDTERNPRRNPHLSSLYKPAHSALHPHHTTQQYPQAPSRRRRSSKQLSKYTHPQPCFDLGS